MQNETFSLLVFHGSARSDANNAAFNFADKIINSGCHNFSVCFLKGVKPDLQQALTQAAEAGHTRIKIIPLFLLPGSHIQKDIPEIIETARIEFPKLQIIVEKCLVDWPEFVFLLIEKLK